MRQRWPKNHVGCLRVAALAVAEVPSVLASVLAFYGVPSRRRCAGLVLASVPGAVVNFSSTCGEVHARCGARRRSWPGGPGRGPRRRVPGAGCRVPGACAMPTAVVENANICSVPVRLQRVHSNGRQVPKSGEIVAFLR